jgi:hypothetical protein
MSTNRDEAHAWLAFAEGTNDEALSLLRSVADKQDAEGKGEVVCPARNARRRAPGSERPREALPEYEKSMETDPIVSTVSTAPLRRIDPTATYRRSLLRTTPQQL